MWMKDVDRPDMIGSTTRCIVFDVQRNKVGTRPLERIDLAREINFGRRPLGRCGQSV